MRHGSLCVLVLFPRDEEDDDGIEQETNDKDGIASDLCHRSTGISRVLRPSSDADDVVES